MKVTYANVCHKSVDFQEENLLAQILLAVGAPRNCARRISYQMINSGGLMTRFFKACSASLTVALMGMASLSAHADPVPTYSTYSTFSFSAVCEDCSAESDETNHIVTGSLVLQDYTADETFDKTNFVSFTYDGSNKIPGGFTWLQNQVRNVTGVMGSSSSIHIVLPFDSNSSYLQFLSNNEGLWSTGIVESAADFGTTATWQLVTPTSDVPEPATMLLVGAALAGLGLSRRRRQA